MEFLSAQSLIRSQRLIYPISPPESRFDASRHIAVSRSPSLPTEPRTFRR